MADEPGAHWVSKVGNQRETSRRPTCDAHHQQQELQQQHHNKNKRVFVSFCFYSVEMKEK